MNAHVTWIWIQAITLTKIFPPTFRILYIAIEEKYIFSIWIWMFPMTYLWGNPSWLGHACWTSVCTWVWLFVGRPTPRWLWQARSGAGWWRRWARHRCQTHWHLKHRRREVNNTVLIIRTLVSSMGKGIQKDDNDIDHITMYWRSIFCKTHNKHTIGRPWQRDMGYILGLPNRIYVLL